MESEAFDYLDSPVYRVTAADIPTPYANNLEILSLPQPDNVIRTVKKVLNVQWKQNRWRNQQTSYQIINILEVDFHFSFWFWEREREPGTKNQDIDNVGIILSNSLGNLSLNLALLFPGNSTGKARILSINYDFCALCCFLVWNQIYFPSSFSRFCCQKESTFRELFSLISSNLRNLLLKERFHRTFSRLT